MFASVEEYSNAGWNPCALIAARASCTSSCSGAVCPAGRSPIFTNSASMAPLRVERAAFSAATAWSIRARNAASSRASSSGASERRSNSVHTALGIELIEVPPPVTLAL
jgi:hypothetical protein